MSSFAIIHRNTLTSPMNRHVRLSPILFTGEFPHSQGKVLVNGGISTRLEHQTFSLKYVKRKALNDITIR